MNNKIALIGIHLQDPVPDWTQSLTRFPQGTVHEFFQTQTAHEAKRIDPTCRTIHRHFVSHQDPYLYAQDKAQAARNYLDTFVDDSFLIDAPHINMICDLNEYFGGESPQELAHKIAWAQALARVWATEYRKRPELAHIRLVLARTAVGNDIPVEVARAAHDYDALLSYHPYVPVNNGIILGQGSRRIAGNTLYKASQSTMIEGKPYIMKASQDNTLTANPQDVEWLYFSGRWTTMDEQYRAQGIYIDWVFTEIGPVLYTEDGSGNIHLNAGAGWRWKEVYNANVDGYISALDYWATKTHQWNVQNGNRALGGQMFTTNQPHSGWEYFRTNQPELNTIADYFANWTPEPPPADDLTRLYNTSKEAQVIYPNEGAALQREIRQRGMFPLSNEFRFTGSNGVQWVCQYASKGGNNPTYTYRFPIGDYRPTSLLIQEWQT